MLLYEFRKGDNFECFFFLPSESSSASNFGLGCLDLYLGKKDARFFVEGVHVYLPCIFTREEKGLQQLFSFCFTNFSISCFAFNYLDFLLFWSHPCLTNALLDLSLQLKKAYLGPFLCFFSFLILIHWPPRYSEISAAKVDRHQSSWFCSIALVS